MHHCIREVHKQANILSDSLSLQLSTNDRGTHHIFHMNPCYYVQTKEKEKQLLALCSCESEADSIADNEKARDDGSLRIHQQKPKIHGDAIIALATHIYTEHLNLPDCWYYLFDLLIN